MLISVETFQAKAQWTGHGLASECQSRNFKITLDEPKSLGGEDTAMNPVELLLNALGGCMSICAAAFAKQCGVDLKDFSVDLEGDLDPEGFQGINPNIRTGYQEIRFKMNTVSPSPQENIDKLEALIIKRCPVEDTLGGVPIKRITN